MKSVFTVVAFLLALALGGVAQAGTFSDAAVYKAEPALTLADLGAAADAKCGTAVRTLAALELATADVQTSILPSGICLRLLRCCDRGSASCCAQFDNQCNPP